MESKSPEITIIFNKLNIEAVLSTAMILVLEPGSQAFDVSQLAPQGSQTYYWVGVDPSRVPGFYQTLHGREHKIILDKVITPLGIQLHPFKTKFPPLPEETQEDFVKRGPTLIDQVIDMFKLEDPSFKMLSFHTGHFYDRINSYGDGTEQLRYLALVYKNIRYAEHCIAHNELFSVQHVLDSDVKLYMQDVRKVKNVFSNAYRHITVHDGSVIRNTVQTSIADSHVFHLAKRLALLVHKNFINTTMGLSGPIAYSNMRHVTFDKNYGSPLLLN